VGETDPGDASSTELLWRNYLTLLLLLVLARLPTVPLPSTRVGTISDCVQKNVWPSSALGLDSETELANTQLDSD